MGHGSCGRCSVRVGEEYLARTTACPMCGAPLRTGESAAQVMGLWLYVDAPFEVHPLPLR